MTHSVPCGLCKKSSLKTMSCMLKLMQQSSVWRVQMEETVPELDDSGDLDPYSGCEDDDSYEEDEERAAEETAGLAANSAAGPFPGQSCSTRSAADPYIAHVYRSAWSIMPPQRDPITQTVQPYAQCWPRHVFIYLSRVK